MFKVTKKGTNRLDIELRGKLKLSIDTRKKRRKHGYQNRAKNIL